MELCGASPQSLCFCPEQPETEVVCQLSLGGQANQGLGKGIPSRRNSLSQSKEAPSAAVGHTGWWSPWSPHSTHRSQVQSVGPHLLPCGGPSKDARELCLRFLLSEVTEPPGSISGMWRPDSLSSLSSQSEVHKTTFLFSHSYSNIGPHASQMQLAGGIRGHISCLGCESRWGVKENKERLFTNSRAPLAGAIQRHREWLACSESRDPRQKGKLWKSSSLCLSFLLYKQGQ